MVIRRKQKKNLEISGLQQQKLKSLVTSHHYCTQGIMTAHLMTASVAS